jgi:hypothetical protein
MIMNNYFSKIAFANRIRVDFNQIPIKLYLTCMT